MVSNGDHASASPGSQLSALSTPQAQNFTKQQLQQRHQQQPASAQQAIRQVHRVAIGECTLLQHV